jgi:hypothetical protein
MELRQIRYSVVVAEELNLRRAGKRLHIGAPPLSVQMTKLQQSMGVELFNSPTIASEASDPIIKRKNRSGVAGAFYQFAVDQVAMMVAPRTV